jgi:hypothetical protein
VGAKHKISVVVVDYANITFQGTDKKIGVPKPGMREIRFNCMGCGGGLAHRTEIVGRTFVNKRCWRCREIHMYELE